MVPRGPLCLLKKRDGIGGKEFAKGAGGSVIVFYNLDVAQGWLKMSRTPEDWTPDAME
jgi:hypothetical protein